MRTGDWRTLAVTAAALVFTAGGCAFSRGAEKPAAVDVTIAAADRLNPDEAGASLPTVFRVHLLASGSRAEAAGYEELYRSDPDVLGDTVLATEEVVLSPGEAVSKRIAADKPARALLVVGVFRRPTGSSWRVVVPIERGRPGRVEFHAQDYRVERR